MANREVLQLLGPTERAIMQILWRDGPSTAEHVHAQPQQERADVAYTTVLTPMQRLEKKAL